MSNYTSVLKNFVLNDTKVYQKHHSFSFGTLVLCDGSREGKPLGTLNRYLKKTPKTCYECGFFAGNPKRCKIGYSTIASMPSCRQAIARKEMTDRGY